MDDLYVESFFQHGSVTTLEGKTDTPVIVSEESINQTHFFLRILREEIEKQLPGVPPVPLMLEKLESSIFSQNNENFFALLDDFEELLDLKYLPTIASKSYV
jgi:hypothetical protein